MSELVIALVAEGKTDRVVIEAALNAILNRPFVLNLLQPETSEPFGAAGPHGGGWGGVYRWCQQLVSMQQPITSTLSRFDMVVLHIDADVAGLKYEDANITNGPGDLPCECPCPPPSDTVRALYGVMAGWLGLQSLSALPPNWLLCIPSKCTESWVIAGAFSAKAKAILPGIECNLGLETWLSNRPVTEGKLIKGSKKQYVQYLSLANKISANWATICGHCSQAAKFQADVMATIEGL